MIPFITIGSKRPPCGFNFFCSDLICNAKKDDQKSSWLIICQIFLGWKTTKIWWSFEFTLGVKKKKGVHEVIYDC